MVVIQQTFRIIYSSFDKMYIWGFSGVSLTTINSVFKNGGIFIKPQFQLKVTSTGKWCKCKMK